MNNMYSQFSGKPFELLEVRRPITNTIVVPQGVIHFNRIPKVELDRDTFEINERPSDNSCSFSCADIINDDAAFYMKKLLDKFFITHIFEKYDYIFEFRNQAGNLNRIYRCTGVMPTAYDFQINYSLNVEIKFDKLEVCVCDPAIPWEDIDMWKMINGF